MVDVQLPDGSIGRFPDNMSDSDIEAVLQKQFAPQQPISIGESAISGITAGAAANLNDEAAASMRTVNDKYGSVLSDLFGNGKKPETTYSQNLDEQRRYDKQAYEANPITYTGGAITGAILGGGKLTAPLASTKIGSAIASKTLPTAAGRAVTGIAKAALPAGISGAIGGFGSGEGGVENRLQQAQDDGLLSAGLGVGLKGATGLAKGTGEVVKGAFARGNKELAAANEAMKKATSQAYNEMKKYNVSLNQNGRSKVLDNINEGLQGELIDGELNKNFITLANNFGKQISEGTDIEHLDKWRRKFYSMADGIKSNDPIVKDNARLANIVAKKLDDALYNRLDDNADFIANSTNALEALKAGRANSMQQRKFEIVSDILRKSKGDANYVKRELSKISDASTKKGENQLKFFTPDEIKELAKVADLGVGEAALKIAGKFGFDSARLGRGAAGLVAGGLVGDWLGAATVPAVGTAALMTQKGLVKGRADTLLKTIERGGKSAQSSSFNIPSSAIGAAVSAQRENAQPLNNDGYSPFANGGTQEKPELELQITPQSYNTQMDLPRGLRNNNPANLRGNDLWLGRTGVDEGGFIQFKTPQAGLRAMAINLANQQKKYGINTVSGLISKYAPDSENDTVSYIEKVASDLGVKPNQKIKLTDKKTMFKLMQSMIEHENGNQPYSNQELLQAINAGISE